MGISNFSGSDHNVMNFCIKQFVSKRDAENYFEMSLFKFLWDKMKKSLELIFVKNAKSFIE